MFATISAAMTGRTTAEHARLLAMVFVTQADAGNTCFESKYHYQFWRPSSAITLAHTDGNDATVVDAAGFGRFPLLGVSQGAAVAVEYASRHPDRVSALVLYGGRVDGWTMLGAVLIFAGNFSSIRAETRAGAPPLLGATSSTRP